MMDSDKLPFIGSELDESESKLLKLISECSGTVEGRTKLMKLAFFSEYYNPEKDQLQSDERIGAFDDFIIYNHGPFSRNVMDGFDSLKEDNLVEEETELTFYGDRKKIIHLTEQGEKRIERSSNNGPIQQIVSVFGDKSGTELEQDSLSMLGISREEKQRHRYDPVSELISE